MKKIEVILKVTNACNLKCRYCYNKDADHSEATLSLDRFEKLLNVLLTGYNLIHIIWHGGEPLCAGLDYFKAAMDVEKRVHIQSSVLIENSIQTNGTLINDDWIAFFRENDFKVGISFDGVNNDKYRQGTSKTLAAMKRLKKAGIRFGCNAVVADNDYDLGANYDFFKQQGLAFDFSRLFDEGGAKDMPSLETRAYTQAMCDLFDRWIYDTDGVSVRTFALYLNMISGGRYRICSCCSCHTKYLSIAPDGTIYNCGRDSMGHFPFGSIDEFNTTTEIFASPNAITLLSGSIERRRKCKEACDLFSMCAGGCADIAIMENGLENPPSEYCYHFKTLYRHVETTFVRLMQEKAPLDTLNPTVRSVLAQSLARSGGTTQNELASTYL